MIVIMIIFDSSTTMMVVWQERIPMIIFFSFHLVLQPSSCFRACKLSNALQIALVSYVIDRLLLYKTLKISSIGRILLFISFFLISLQLLHSVIGHYCNKSEEILQENIVHHVTVQNSSLE